MQSKRRSFISGMASVALIPSLPALTRSVHAAEAGVQLVSNNISVISGLGGNVVAFAGSGGTVLVDSGVAAATVELKGHLKAITGTDAVSTLFNTHYHAEQTGGNADFAEDGALIIAHERARQWLGTPFWIPSRLSYSTPAPEAALPAETFLNDGLLILADEQIDYGYLVEAHTSSDIYVKFGQSNVLAVGDVVSPQLDPAFDWYTGAWVGGRKEALDHLLTLCDENTVVVPSFGPLLDRSHIEAERDLMAFLFDKTTELVRRGFGPDDMLADGFMNTLPRQFADPETFLYALCKGLWAHHNKINHNIV